MKKSCLGGKKVNIFRPASFCSSPLLTNLRKDCVSHPASNGGVSQGFTHQVAQQGVGSQETQTDVGGFGEVTENRRV